MRKLKFVLLFIIPQIALSQVTITGIVKDSGSGETLPFANVFVKGHPVGTSTNQDGYFTLLNVADTSTLIISYVGYSSKEFKLNPASARDRVVIRLESISTSLQELIISDQANKFLNTTSGVSQATISTKQLSLLPSIGEVDIFRSLQLLPGVSGTNENSSGLYVRGGTPDQNLVLLDGITIYKVDHFFGFFSAFNTNAIKDVQLYKGGFPAKYGGRISSVVDLTGKSGNFEKVHGEAGINLISANAFVEVPVSSKVSFLFAGRRSFTDIMQSNLYKKLTGNLIGENTFTNLPNTPNATTSTNAVEPLFYFYDWNSKLSFRPNNKDLFTISMYQGSDFLDESRSLLRTITNVAANPIEARANVEEKTEWGNRGISGKWSRQWSPKFYSNVTLAASQYFSKYNRRGFLDVTIPAQDSTILKLQQFTFEDNLVSDFSARMDGEWLLSSRHRFELGASFTQSSIDYKNIRNDTLIILNEQQKASYSSVYVSDTWQPTYYLSVTAGVRTSYYELTHDFLVAPRISAIYSISSNLKLKGAFGKYFQFVNQITNESITEGSRDFWLLADGNRVDVSSAYHYIAGISYENKGWLFDLEGYYKDIQGLSEFSLRFRRGAEIDLNNLFFSGTGIAKGAEILIQKKQGNYTGWISYTLGSVRYNFPEINNGRNFPALHDQRHEFKTIHSYQPHDEWNFSATFIYGSGKPFSEPEGKYSVELLDGKSSGFISIGPKNGSRLPVYSRIDVAVHHLVPLGDKLKGDFGVSVFNVLNRKNTWYKQYDFAQEPVLVTDVRYLGMMLNLSVNIKF